MRGVCAILLVVVTGCASFPRRLDYRLQRSQAMNGATMEYAVYAPRGHTPSEALPLVVFLHGGGDSHDAFDRHRISPRLDEAVEAGRVPRAVILLPNGELGFWPTGTTGAAATRTGSSRSCCPRSRSTTARSRAPRPATSWACPWAGPARCAWRTTGPIASSTVTAISGPVMNTEQMIRFANDRLLSIFVPMHRVFGPL
ncbi:MAG: hypothetical protein M5U28_56365 [Sandaracinaceae bacterium]|nr:hypothetical protein [Sandaracinaceae bacterium]